MDRNAINHRGPEFGALGRDVVAKLRAVFQTGAATIGIFPASGTGAWESALANTLVPGDRILISRTGQFSHLWEQMALCLGLDVMTLETDWRRGADPNAIGQVLELDREHKIKAVFAVHSETSTSCMTDIAAVRQAMNRASHPALLMVDAISSLGCADYRHDEWEVDVTIAGSQKGLMVPPGLAFTAISDKALAAARAGGSRRSYWDWAPLVVSNKTGFFPYTPAVNLLFALNEALDMLAEEGLPAVFARHSRYAEATRLAVAAWGLELQCADPAAYAPGRDRDPHPGGPQRRQSARRHPGEVQHEPRQWPWPHRGPGVPHRPYGRPRRAVVYRRADRRGDGAARGWHTAQGRRRAGGDALSGRAERVSLPGVCTMTGWPASVSAGPARPRQR